MATFKIFDIDSIPTSRDLLNEYLVNVITTATGLTDISVGSKLWTMGYAASRALASAYYTLHFYRKQSFVVTATGKYLDLHAIEAGLTRHKANFARGVATFSRSAAAPYDLLVESGTIITTPVTSSSVPVIRFATTEDAIIKRGEISTNVGIICLTAGIDGNLASGSITRIETEITGAQFVVTTSTSGGTLQETDESLRMRILTAWVARESGTANAIRNAVLSVQGIKTVIITDPARNRVKQNVIFNSLTENLPQVKLTTISPITAKYDLYATITPTTCEIEQIDSIGNVVGREVFDNISSGFDLIDRINFWGKSIVLKLYSLALDSNPYDDPVPSTTDNEVATIVTISPDTSANDISLLITEQPGSDAKMVVISTTAQYKHNNILGQIESSPVVEVYNDIYTYSGLAECLNSNSNLVRMYLLDKKVATQELTPIYNGTVGANTVVTTFRPIVDIISPKDNDIFIIDPEAGLINVGGATTPISFSYRYKACMMVNGNRTEFGDLKPGNVSAILKPNGSTIVYATAVGVPDVDDYSYDYSHCGASVKIIERTKFTSKYEMMRGVVEVMPIPFAVTDEAATNSVLQEAITAIETVKPAGIEVVISKPKVLYVNVEVTVAVTAESGYSPSAFYSVIINGITNYINALDMGETAYRDKIIAAANPDIEGLAVAHIVAPLVDITPPSITFLRAGTISCSAAEVE